MINVAVSTAARGSTCRRPSCRHRGPRGCSYVRTTSTIVAVLASADVVITVADVVGDTRHWLARRHACSHVRTFTRAVRTVHMAEGHYVLAHASPAFARIGRRTYLAGPCSIQQTGGSNTN